jgi:hypothetical protein
MKSSDVNDNFRDSARRFAQLYIDTSRQFGQAMLELHEKSTTWARETALNPIFEAQRTAGKQMLDGSIEIARRVWRVVETEEDLASRTP